MSKQLDTLPLPLVEPAQKGHSAIVLFSGGQDSTTCLYWALRHYRTVHALAFDYGQRHAVELQQAELIAAQVAVPFKILPLEALSHLGGSSLTDNQVKVNNELQPNNLPNSFVPGRNLLFLSLAAAYAYPLGIRTLVSGMCQTDYSGYPDCRRPFADTAAQAISLAMDTEFVVETPLMYLDKAQTWRLAAALGCLEQVVSQSHTCYNGNRTTLHPWGYGCGQCPACLLRAKGYTEAFGN